MKPGLEGKKETQVPSLKCFQKSGPSGYHSVCVCVRRWQAVVAQSINRKPHHSARLPDKLELTLGL